MIQRRVKWKKGVTVENGYVEARRALGTAQGLVLAVGAWVAAVFFRARRGSIAPWLRAGAWESDCLPFHSWPLTMCVALRRLFHFTRPQFLHLHNGPTTN